MDRVTAHLVIFALGSEPVMLPVHMPAPPAFATRYGSRKEKDRPEAAFCIQKQLSDLATH